MAMIWTDSGLRKENKRLNDIILELQETINNKELMLIDQSKEWTEKYGKLERDYNKVENGRNEAIKKNDNLTLENRDLKVIKTKLQNLIKTYRELSEIL